MKAATHVGKEGKQETNPKHHGALHDAGDSGICRLEQALDGLDVADVAFSLDHFASVQKATVDDPGGRLIADTTPTADDEVSSTVLGHVDS